MTDPQGKPFYQPNPPPLTDPRPRELDAAPLSRAREPTYLLDRYQRLLETITDYVYVVRVESGRVVETQHGLGCIAVTGYSSQEFADDPMLWLQMVHPADRKLVSDLGPRILSGEEVAPIEHRITHKNGNQRWVSNTPILKHDEQGNLIGYDGIVRDITDFKRNILALQELREQQQRAGQLLTTILSHTFMAAVYLDTEGNCLWVNDAFAKNAQRPASYFTGKNLFSLHPELTIRHTLAQVVKTREPLIGSALPLTFPDQPERGTTYWDFSLYPIADTTQTIIGLVLTMAEVTTRIRMEEQIRASELRYRTVANYTYDWEYWENSDGSFSYCSPSCLRVTGHHPEEFLNQPGLLDSLIFEEDRTLWRDYRTELRNSNAPRELDFRIHKPDGRVCWLTQRCATVTSDEGTHLGWRASTRDITDRKHFELQLRTQAELLNLSPVCVSVYDELGRFSYANQLAPELHGYSREEYFAMTEQALRTEEYAAQFTAQLEQLRAEGSLAFQLQHRRKDGQVITLWTATQAMLIDGKLHILSVATDITERERATNALTQSEAMLRALFDAVEESIILLDASGQIITCNHVAATRLNTSITELVQRSVFEFVPADIAELRKTMFEKVIRSNQVANFEDTRANRRLEHTIYPITDHTGKVTRAAIFATDTTERHANETRLRRTNELLLKLRDSQSRFMNTGDPQPVYVTLLDALVELSESTFGYLERLTDSSELGPLALVTRTNPEDAPRLRAELSTLINPLWVRNGSQPSEPIYGTKHLPNAQKNEQIQSYLGIPLVYGGQVVGVIALANRARGFEPSIVEVLAPFTTTCAATIHAVQTMQLYREQGVLLRDSENANRTIVESVPGIVYRIAINQRWHIEHVSSGIVPVTGYTVEELTSPSFDLESIINQEDHAQLKQLVEFAIQSKQSLELEYRINNKAGEVRWLHAKGQVTRSANESTTYLDGVAIDITERKSAQSALAAKTEELERYFSVSLDLLCIADLQGRFRHLNAAWTQTLGYPTSDLEGQNLIDLVHPDDRGKTQIALTQLFEHCPLVSLTIRCRHVDGSYRHIEWRAYPSENAIYAAARDVTARVLAEVALKESESRYRILLENTPDIIAHVDADGRFLYVSPSVAAITDIPPNDLIGKTYRDIDVNSNDAFLWQARIERVVTSGKSDEAEINIETKHLGTNVFNWRLFPIREHNGNRSVLSLARNVTEQKRLEREYQALFNEMLSPLAVHEVLGTAFDQSENYRLIAVNPAFERMTGLGSEDILGRTLKEVLPNTDSRWLDIYGQVATSGTPVHFEAHFTDLGRLFEVTAFRSATRQVACIYTDISERRRLQEQYHQSAKLEAIGRLASGVAHDLNNLLMPILGYSEVALEMLEPDDSRAAPLKEIRSAGQQAKGLVRQLLTFGQKQRLEVQKVDLNSVVSGFALLLERALRENIRFSLVTSPTPLWLEADVGQLELILMTLAVNAQESMPSGGTLTIEVSAASVGTGTTQYGSSPPPSSACLTVRDDGPGLDIESQERLFEPYFSTHSNKEEKQLGLSTVHAIVVQHGGSVSVRSAPGMGTEFIILLPLVDAARQIESGSETQIPHSQAKTTGTILVVEDNPLVRDLTVRALESQGYRVCSATDGKDCLARFGNSTEPFDLLLTDIIMPDMNGKALYEVLSARYPHLKVAYMSGYSKAFITQQQGLDPSITFFQKPFSMRKLLATVREILDRK